MLLRLASVLTVIAAISASLTVPVLADTMTSIGVTGFNRDMIVEAGGGIDAINASFDGGWGTNGSAGSMGTSLYGQGVLGDATRGLVDGVYTSNCNSNTTFQLQAFNSNNALYLDHDAHTTGTLTLTSPKAFNQLAFFSTGGSSQVQYTIHYADTTTTVNAFYVTDWFAGGSSIAENAKGRVYWDGSAWAAEPATEGLTGSGASIYQTTITGVDSTKSITSIEFAMIDSGTKKAAVFALSGHAVPEPCSLLMLISGSLGLLVYAWKNRK